VTVFLPPLTLVLGGAASGKSSWAESLVIKSDRPRIYVATAEGFDTEMKDKIAAHRVARGPDWTTIEAPLNLVGAIGQANANHVILIDCATLWLTNILLADKDVTAASNDLVTALANAPCPVVIVSNEVGQGVVPDNALSRKFRNAQGRLNQDIAAHADTVVAVMAGLPLALKGQIL